MNILPVYYIQFRFSGSLKDKIRKLIVDTYKRFNLKPEKVIPHITLAGPFYTGNEELLIKTFYRFCAHREVMCFQINGFGFFDEKRVIFLKVRPGNEMINFRNELAQALKAFCKLSIYDTKEDFAFHSTLQKNLPPGIFESIKELFRYRTLNYSHLMARCTLLKNGCIISEYDFFLRLLMDRRMALDVHFQRLTIYRLKNYLKNCP